MDAFNAAGRFTQQGLGVMGQIKQEEADAWLRNVPAKFSTEIQNHIRDNPFNYTGDPDDAEGLANYTQEYMDSMKNYASEWYSKETGGRAAVPYIKRNIDHLQTQSLESIRNMAFVKQDEWRIQREHISRDEDNLNTLDALKRGDITPEQAVTAINNRNDLSGKRVEINAQQRNEMRKAYEATAFQEYASTKLGQVKDVNRLEAVMNEVRSAFDFMPPDTLNTYDEEGNVIGTEERPWGFKGKDEYEKDLIKQETLRIQGEHFENFREKQAYRDRLIASGRYAKAIEFDKIWGSEWNKYYDSRNVQFANSNDDLRDRGSGFFNSKTLEGYLKMGGDGPKAIELEVNPGRFIRAALPGGGGFVLTGEDGEGLSVESLRDAWEKFISLKEQAFRLGRGEAGYGAIADSDWRYERDEWFKKFKTEMRLIIQEDEHKSLWKTYSKLLDHDTYRNDKTPYYLKGKVTEEQRERFIQDCVSLTVDLFYNGVTDEAELDRRVKAFIVGNIEKNLIWGQTPDKEGDLIKKLSVWDREVVTEGKAKDQVFSKNRMETAQLFSNEPGEDELVWRHENFKKDAFGVRDAEWDLAYRMLEITGITKGKLKPGWMLSEDRERDPIAKGIFTVEDGDNKGTYRVGYDENANPVLMKKNSDTGSWDETEFKMQRPRITEEQIRRKEEIQKQFEMNHRKYRQMVEDGLNPLTGEAAKFEWKTTPPPGSSYTQKMWDDLKDVGGRPSATKMRVWMNYYQKLAEEE
jgi:hypothetical protein